MSMRLEETGPQPSMAGIRWNALKRLVLWHALSGRLPLYLVAAYPKSGGTWFSQMLAAYLDVPFARNTTPPPFSESVLHGHHLFQRRFRNVTCVLRDGRDVMLSSYYHSLFYHERNHWPSVRRNRRILGFRDLEDVVGNLPRYIEFRCAPRSRHRRRFSWSDFVRSWVGRGVHVVRYEHLLTDPVESMREAVAKLVPGTISRERMVAVVDRFSFGRQSGRVPGKEAKGSFLRKGVAGDWRQVFSLEARQVFDQFAGPALVHAGYESTNEWVDH